MTPQHRSLSPTEIELARQLMTIRKLIDMVQNGMDVEVLYGHSGWIVREKKHAKDRLCEMKEFSDDEPGSLSG